MKSEISHNIKHRESPNDEFYTPTNLVKKLIPMIPFSNKDTLFDPAYGTGNFYNNYPNENIKGYSKDFYSVSDKWDWLITNPPYSDMENWLKKSCEVAKKGFAYLILEHALTPRRIELCEKQGFGITKIHKCKVFKWYGISEFVLFEKGKQGIISYDRIVWRD